MQGNAGSVPGLRSVPIKNGIAGPVPSADESAAILAGLIRDRKPFFFVRFGDGAIECLAGKQGMTRDGERYSPQLAGGLRLAWQSLMRGKNVYVGDWLSASFDASSEHARYADQYAALIGDGQPVYLHFEALLLMRESPVLREFYRAVKQDPRKKLYMGPAENAGAAKLLGAEHLITPMTDLYSHCEKWLTDALLTRDFDVLLYGAGMAGNIPVVHCWEKHPERTFINLGSGLDPLFMNRKTRRQQIHPASARRFLAELL